jgi:hypothetical protein
MKTIKIPKFFLFQENHIKRSISFLRKLITTRSNKIAIDFSSMEDTSKGDIMIFTAQIEKAMAECNKQFFRMGKMPSNRKTRKLLLLSYKMIHQNQSLSSNLSDAEKASLVNPAIIDGIVKELRKIGIKNYYFPFYIFLTEIIGNAVEHGIENRKINWWLFQDIDFINKSIKYTFVDMGNGIIKTHKKAKLPFKYFFLPECRIVLDSFKGRLGSSTKEPNRGKGLPQLMKMIDNEIVSNMLIITNKINLRYKNNCFKSGKNPNFVGTYYCWTINSYNYDKWTRSL